MSTEEFYDRETYIRYGVPGEQGREIRGLRIAFEIFKDDTSTPNRGKFTVWGLSAASVAALQRPGLVLTFFGGYGGQATLCFVGDVTRAVSTIRGAESVTVIESGDGHATQSKARSRVAIKGKTTLKGVLKKVFKGVVASPKKLLTGLSSGTANQSIPRGFSASGPTKTILRGLARARRFDWAVQDGEYVILDRDAATREPAVLLTPVTGLIDSPARTQSKPGKPPGVQCKSLLNGRIRPRRIINLQSASYTGYYLARKVTHKGDSGWSAEYFTIIEATEIAA